MIKNKRIFITGGSSMIGRAVIELLKDNNEIIAPSKEDCDMCFGHDFIDYMFPTVDYVIHLATYSGNLQFNQKYPADTFFRTTNMGLNILRASAQLGVKKVLSVISSCAIAESDKELKESDLHKGPPNPSIESHGYAKRILDIYSRQLNKQYGLNAVCCIVNNSFGPYDSFSPEKTKVVGAMIKRFVDAKEQKLPYVECWGTGKAKREFVYCKDVARLLILALEKYNDCTTPINIGSSNEVTIKQLAETTAELVGYDGEIRWLSEKGDGQLRKKLDLSKMNSILLQELDPDSFCVRKVEFNYTSFKDALFQTVLWYKENKNTWTK